jgi:hypothetical protein
MRWSVNERKPRNNLPGLLLFYEKHHGGKPIGGRCETSQEIAGAGIPKLKIIKKTIRHFANFNSFIIFAAEILYQHGSNI